MNITKPSNIKIIVAPNALKGSLTAEQAARSIELGIKKKIPRADVVSFLVSDGGDGFVESLSYGLYVETYSISVSGPLGKPVLASFLYSSEKQIAIIEMATASGLVLLDEDELEPMKANTYGLGQLILATLDQGAQHIVLGIGGSATNDGGTGMATALGIQFLDIANNPLSGNADNLHKIAYIDFTNIDSRLNTVTFDIACDVNNLLLGEQGAAVVYGPQKGATPDQVSIIENGLSNLATVIERDLGVDVRSIEGGGAAGGLGAALYAFLGGKIKPGAELLLDLLNFDSQLQNASLVITTEGKLDFQTGFGKAPSIVANRANKLGVPTIIISGQIDYTNLNWHELGFFKVYSLCDETISSSYAIAHADKLLTEKSERVIDDFLAQNSSASI